MNDQNDRIKQEYLNSSNPIMSIDTTPCLIERVSGRRSLPQEDITKPRRWSIVEQKISKQTKNDLLELLRQRYERAGNTDKGKIFDEFVAVAGCQRKQVIRLLISNHPLTADTPVGPRRRYYDEAVRQALIVLWEAADRICGKRLKAVLPDLLAAMVRHGHLNLDDAVRRGRHHRPTSGKGRNNTSRRKNLRAYPNTPAAR